MSNQHPVPMRTVLSHVAVPILMGLVMAVAYLGGFHKPSPHEVPLAVVGPTQQVQPIAAGLEHQLGDEVDVRIVPTVDQATQQLRNLDISGAYVPGRASAEMLTASGASDTTRSVVGQIGSAVALKQGVPLRTVDVAPVSDNDPAGQNGFFFLVALTVGSYATSIAIGAAAASHPMRRRAALAAVAGALIPTLSFLVARFGFGMFAGDSAAVWGLSVLYSEAVLLIGVGLHPLIGRFSTLVYSAVFVALNFTTSGGVFSPAMQPAFFGWLHSFWIGSGFVESVRQVMYLPDVSIAGPLTILVGWFALGLVSLAIGSAVERRRATVAARPTREELDAATLEELEEDVAV
ncbi:hypothetical protein [Luteipulveratus flavus]|uniref:DUF3533 domain-containing protein n=1 Tax=Luteipulveratus flavus TaxID=3031728 RepID=A0ABT6CD42_9MICO|nr:hypothetical protein [Luteipulveratus sp. YIM 133296]MDF8265196.1 hypothetical protein [Luteipulveratus sp. YIM 133296]